MTDERAFFARVQAFVERTWPNVIVVGMEGETMDDGHDLRFMSGRFGEVIIELFAQIRGGTQIVRVTCEMARFCPLDAGLLQRLNWYNEAFPLTAFSINHEDELPGTVAVRVSGSAVGELVGEGTIAAAMQECVGPANYLLEQGFLDEFGGRSGLAVMDERFGRQR